MKNEKNEKNRRPSRKVGQSSSLPWWPDLVHCMDDIVEIISSNGLDPDKVALAVNLGVKAKGEMKKGE